MAEIKIDKATNNSYKMIRKNDTHIDKSTNKNKQRQQQMYHQQYHIYVFNNIYIIWQSE